MACMDSQLTWYHASHCWACAHIPSASCSQVHQQIFRILWCGCWVLAGTGSASYTGQESFVFETLRRPRASGMAEESQGHVGKRLLRQRTRPVTAEQGSPWHRPRGAGCERPL